MAHVVASNVGPASSPTVSAILNLSRTSAILVEIAQLDRYWREEAARITASGQSSGDAIATLQPVLDRLGQLLTEFQTKMNKVATAGSR